MGWPNNYAEYAYDINGNASLIDGSGISLNLVKSIGQSTAVAAAMEAFSDALPKGQRYNFPEVTEQGVIELGPYAYNLEKTINIDVSGATSKYGLTIRGQGPETTKLVASETSSAANFKGVDNIWRMLKITGSGSDKLNHSCVKDIGFFNYFTQNGDGVTNITDAVRTVDFKYMTMSDFDRLFVYVRNFDPAYSTSQYAYYFANNYYAKARSLRAHFFSRSTGTQAGVAANNIAKPKSVGTAYGFSVNNAFQGYGLFSIGSDTGFYLNNEIGLSIIGGDLEYVNKPVVMDNGSRSNSITKIRTESHYLDSGYSLESRDNHFLAKFSETTKGNTVEILGEQANRQGIFDYSPDKSNKVIAPTLVFNPRKTTPLVHPTITTADNITTTTGLATCTRATGSFITDGVAVGMLFGPQAGATIPANTYVLSVNSATSLTLSGNITVGAVAVASFNRGTPNTVGTITVTSDLDIPTNYDGLNSINLALNGSYNFGRYYPFTVNPDCGSISVVMAIKRVSGDGMMTPYVESAPPQPTSDGVRLVNLLDSNIRWRNQFVSAYTINVLSGSWLGGNTTLNCNKPHLLQVGMRTQLTGVGSLGAATNAYVTEVISSTSIKVGTTDPGAISGGTIGLPVDMTDWLDQPNVTNDWVWIATSAKIRQYATALSLNGSNHPVITSSIISGLTTGHVIKLSGFAEPSLNVEYTIQAGDVTGPVLTCSLLTIPSMLTTATGNDTTTTTYGYVGIKNLRVNLRCTTTSGTAIVWRMTQPIVYQGYNDVVDY